MASFEDEFAATEEQTGKLSVDAADGRPGEESRLLSSSGIDELPLIKRPSPLWLVPAFLIITLAMGAMISPMINLMLALKCRDYYAKQILSDPKTPVLPVIFGEDNKQCQKPEILALVSKLALVVNLCVSITSAIMAPKLGALSDRIGRTKVLCVSAVGLMFDDVAYILSMWYPDAIGTRGIIASGVIGGMFGSIGAVMAVTNSYATDTTSSARRAVVFGYYYGSLFLGLAVGPTLGGLLVKYTGNLLSVFYVAFVMHVSFAFYVLFVVPESLSEVTRGEAKERYVKTVGGFKGHVNVFRPLKIFLTRDRRVRRNLLTMIFIDAVLMGLGMGMGTVMMLYSEQMFGWGTAETSYFISVMGSGRVIVLLVALPLLVKYCRGVVSHEHTGIDKFEINCIRVGLVVEVSAFVLFASVTSSTCYLLIALVVALGGIISPNLQAGLTKTVPHAITGQVLGGLALTHALARCICPTVLNLIYASTAATFPQAVFVFGGSLYLIAFGLSFLVQPHVYMTTAED